MEENVLEQGLSNDNIQSKLSNQDLSYLKTAATWAKFLAILGFIGSAFCLLGGIAFATIFASIPTMPNTINGGVAMPKIFGPAIGIIYLLIAVPYFFISLYLNRFSNNVNRTWRTNSPTELSNAFKNIRNYFRLFGWMVIGIFIIYIFFVFAMFGMMSSSMLGR